MNITKKIIIVMFMMVMSICFIEQSASAKSASQITKFVTLTKNKLVTHTLSIRRSEKVGVKVEFLNVKGTVTERSTDLMFGGYEFDGGKGSFFSNWSTPKLCKSSFKKGKKLQLRSPWKDGYISGKAFVEWQAPRGITKLKLKITYYTKSGKKNIKSIKKNIKSIK